MSEIDDLLLQAEGYLPYPLARPIRRRLHSRSNRDRYEFGLALGDQVVVFLGVIGLAHAMQAGLSLPTVANWWSAFARQGVSLGTWRDLTISVAKCKSVPTTGAQNPLETLRTTKGVYGALDELVNIRNARGHGTPAPTEGEASRRLEGLEPVLETLLSACEFLAAWQLLFVQSSTRLRRSRNYETLALNLTGSHPDFRPIELLTEDSYPASTAVLKPTEHGLGLELSPFVAVLRCPTCLSDDLWFSDRLKRGVVRYRDFYSGHQSDSKDSFVDFEDLATKHGSGAVEPLNTSSVQPLGSSVREAAPSPVVGDLIDNRYRLTANIRTFRNSTVFLCEDIEYGHPFQIEFVLEATSIDRNRIIRLLSGRYSSPTAVEADTLNDELWYLVSEPLPLCTSAELRGAEPGLFLESILVTLAPYVGTKGRPGPLHLAVVSDNLRISENGDVVLGPPGLVPQYQSFADNSQTNPDLIAAVELALQFADTTLCGKLKSLPLVAKAKALMQATQPTTVEAGSRREQALSVLQSVGPDA